MKLFAEIIAYFCAAAFIVICGFIIFFVLITGIGKQKDHL